MARTVVNLDEKALRAAMRYGGFKRKVDVVNEGLRVLARQRRALRILDELAGKVKWEGDWYEMRHGRPRPRRRTLHRATGGTSWRGP